MAQLTFAELRGELAARFGLRDVGDNTATLKRGLNWGARRVYNARPWPERHFEPVVDTVGQYPTGTVLVTNNSAAVVGTGTAWTVGMQGRKLALALGGPHYRVLTVTDGTHLTLERVYLGTTAPAATYLLYADEYDFPTTVMVVRDAGIIYTPTRGQIPIIPLRYMNAAALVPSCAGVPSILALASPFTTPKTPRFRLYPVPDGQYGIWFKALRAYVDMIEDADVCPVSQDREELLLRAAEIPCYKVFGLEPRETQASIAEGITEAWSEHRALNPRVGQRLPFDHPRAGFGLTLDLSGIVS